MPRVSPVQVITVYFDIKSISRFPLVSIITTFLCKVSSYIDNSGTWTSADRALPIAVLC